MELVSALAKALDAKQAVDIRVYDVSETSSITDYHLLATGTSGPHLRALAGELRQSIKQLGAPGYRNTGDPESGWIVADCVDVIVHLLSDEARAYYALDKLWEEAPQVELVGGEE